MSCLELFFLSIITTTFFKYLYFNRDLRAVSLMTKCASNEILTFQEGQAETTPQYMFYFSHNPTPFSFPNKIIIFVGLWALIFIFFLFFFSPLVEPFKQEAEVNAGFPWNLSTLLFVSILRSRWKEIAQEQVTCWKSLVVWLIISYPLFNFLYNLMF